MGIVGNHTPLTPLSFLRRNARVYPGKTAVVYGARRYSYREFYERAIRLANGLRALGVGEGDCVALRPTRRLTWRPVSACPWPAAFSWR